MKFGDYLRQRREGKGWTQPEAAAKAGIEQSYLSKLETGKSYPSEDVYSRLVTAYEIDADDLVQQVGSSELAKLREISQVRTAILDAQKGQRAVARGWMIAGLLCLASAGACLGVAVNSANATTEERRYQSLGVLLPDEPMNAFEIVRTYVEDDDPNFEAIHTKRAAMLARLDQKEVTITGESRGFVFVEKVPDGVRTYALVDTRLIPSPLRWFIVPALALFGASLGCAFISFRWK